MGNPIDAATVPAAGVILASLFVVVVVPVYRILAHREPPEADRERIRAACADAGVDPRFVRVFEDGTGLGATTGFRIPGLSVVSVSERLLREGSTDEVAAAISVQTGRARFTYVVPWVGAIVVWSTFADTPAFEVSEAVAGRVEEVGLLVYLGLFGGPLLVAVVGYTVFALRRGAARSVDRLGTATTRSALERARRTARSRLTRFAYGRALAAVDDPGEVVADAD